MTEEIGDNTSRVVKNLNKGHVICGNSKSVNRQAVSNLLKKY